MITVQSDIPLPPSKHAISGPTPDVQRKYPFSIMEIGDSFYVPGVDCNFLISRCSNYRPKKFAARIVVESGIKGARIWRTA